MSIVLSYNRETGVITDNRKHNQAEKVFTVSRNSDPAPEKSVVFTFDKREVIKQEPLVFKLNR